ncbi:MAG TPA: histidine triad nucleotide-binding protein [Limnobacter sp.]|nr:histidine triad nucleotide-binding protein [Limnobacter sp.]
MSDCIFCKIVAGEIPSRKVYEDEDILAFHDINPVAPVHFLIIPKKHIPTLADAAPEDIPVLGKMMQMAGTLAKQAGCTDGFRTVVNTGRVGCQEVYHLHIHILGGDKPLGMMLPR